MLRLRRETLALPALGAHEEAWTRRWSGNTEKLPPANQPPPQRWATPVEFGSVDTLNKPVPQNPDPVASQPPDSTPWERSTLFRVSSVSGILQTASAQSMIPRHTHRGRNPQSRQENPDPERTQKLGWSGRLCVPAPGDKVSDMKEKVGLPSLETETGNVAAGDKSTTPMKNAFLGLASAEDTDRRESRSFSKSREITQTKRGETGGNQENRAEEVLE